jgi:hypothetical protein
MVSTNGNGKTSLSTLKKIQITDERIFIHNLEISGKDAANYLQQVPEQERDRICICAFKAGFQAMQTTQNTQEIEFVKRQIASLLSDVEKAIALIPNTVQQELISKLGTKDGQVLAPVQRQINEVSAVTKERVNEVKMLLSQDIDPSKETSVLGNALKTIKNLLDATRNDSVQEVLTNTLKDVSAENGTLAKAVKSVVVEAVKPLADEVDRLSKEIRGKQAAKDALQQTTAKGITYEETVVAQLQHWSKLAGAEVRHVGTDNNSGDILIKLTPKSITATELSIIIEARDRSQPEINAIALSDQIARMRTTLKRITSINKHLTTLRQSANSIETEADTLKNEFRDALTSIEDAMRTFDN